MRRRLLLTLLVMPVALVAVASTAWAYVNGQGSGSGSARVGSLAAPTGVGGMASGDGVAVAWTGVASPGAGPLGYYVMRTPVPSGTTVNVCGTPAVPLGATITTCEDVSVPAGTYKYRVAATYASWTATSAASPDVTVLTTTSTMLELSSPSVTSGGEQLETFTVTTAPSGDPGPTGTVDVRTGAVLLCTVTLPDTSCSPDPEALDPSVIPYRVTATYSGDGSFAGSTSDPSDLTVSDPLVITTASLGPAWAAETGYSQTLTATGGFGAYSWSVNSGVLPFGIHLGRDTGVVSGTLDPGDSSASLSIRVTDGNGASVTKPLTFTVVDAFVGQVSAAPSGTSSSLQVTLTSGVAAGHTLVLTVAQACATGAGVPVDSRITAVAGDALTWARAASTGCTAQGDAEIWYGLHTTTAGTSTKVTVTLAAAAQVQFANVTEYTDVTGWDSAPGASSTASGLGAQVSSGPSTPSTAGELVVGGAFVTRATPSSMSGLVDPFADLNVVAPDKGFGVYAVDATPSPLTLAYTQVVGGTPTAGPWSAAITSFTLAP